MTVRLTKKGNLLRAFLVVVLCTMTTVCSSTAQPQQSSGSQYKKAPTVAADPLKNKVDLPDLPDFTGHAKFVRGVSSNTDHCQNYLQFFVASEDPTQVLDWYKNTLSMYKWNISYAGPICVTADKEQNTCSIMVSNSDSDLKSKNAKTLIQISYQLRTR